jgi:putative FmdB family regulatory protein
VPTYEYRCKSCKRTFERFQPITAKPVRRCPKCGKAVERLIGTGAGIIFKGSGFYCTDYRSEAYKQKAKGEAAPAAADSGGASAAKTGGGDKPASPAQSGGEKKGTKGKE